MSNIKSQLTIIFILLGMFAININLKAVYDPTKGRFLSRDPIQEKGGNNLYAFVKNSTINFWDHLGLADIFLLYDGMDPMFKKWAISTMEKIKSHQHTMYGNTIKYDSQKDKIHVLKFMGWATLNHITNSKNCVSYLATFGHGGHGKIWFNKGKWNPSLSAEDNVIDKSFAFGVPGAFTNNKKSEVRSLDAFASIPFKEGAIFELYHCKTLRKYRFYTNENGERDFDRDEKNGQSPVHYLRQILAKQKVSVFGYIGGINNSSGAPTPSGGGISDDNPETQKPGDDNNNIKPGG
jgi:hypothetical protein